MDGSLVEGLWAEIEVDGSLRGFGQRLRWMFPSQRVSSDL